MGASGNMVMAALYELLPDKTAFIQKMKKLGLPGVVLKCTESVKCGITGTHISVMIEGVEEVSDDVPGYQQKTHDHEHDHDHDSQTIGNKDGHGHKRVRERITNHIGRKGKRYGYNEILELIQGLNLPDKVKTDAQNVYKIIGEAEANVHGTSIEEIHFHEVGSLDAIVDVVGCSLLIDMLGISEVTASPVHVGFGMVRCEHGILPVPTPATAEILKNIPMYSGQIEGELCTPTGAALLKYFVNDFGKMPPMVVKKTGYGMGTKDFTAANCLRVFLYDDGSSSENQDYVCEISCNLDDMTPESIGAVFELLLVSGALDVYITPIIMKKNRSAVILSCLCTEDNHDTLAKIMIKHTTTLGVRTMMYYRTILDRKTRTVETEYGDIRVKIAEGFGIVKMKPEYDDVLEASKKHNIPFNVVYEAAKQGTL